MTPAAPTESPAPAAVPRVEGGAVVVWSKPPVPENDGSSMGQHENMFFTYEVILTGWFLSEGYRNSVDLVEGMTSSFQPLRKMARVLKLQHVQQFIHQFIQKPDKTIISSDRSTTNHLT